MEIGVIWQLSSGPDPDRSNRVSGAVIFELRRIEHANLDRVVEFLWLGEAKASMPQGHPFGFALWRLDFWHGALVAHAVFRTAEARRHVEDRLACLMGDNAASGEGAPIANPVDDEADRDVVAARP